MEAAFDVLRGVGTSLEDTRIRPAQVYHDVKITGAESELYAVHEPVLSKSSTQDITRLRMFVRLQCRMRPLISSSTSL